MSESMANIVSQFKSTIHQLYGEKLSKVILFGSYARGDAGEDSDIDFLVVLKENNISPFKEIEKINNEVYNIILKTGKIISFVPVAEDKFENAPNFFYTQVKREGKIV